MTFTLTERDKKLLMLVSCAIVVLICVQYMILPAIENKQSLEAELAELELKQAEWQLQIGRLPALAASIEENRTARDEASAPYYPILETREMDRVITTLVLEHDLFPQALTLPEAAPGAVADYLYFTPPTNRDLRLHDYVHIGTANLEVTGNVEDWTALLDTIFADYPGLRVTSFDLEEITYLGVEEETIRTHRIVSTMEIYMYPAEEEVAA